MRWYDPRVGRFDVTIVGAGPAGSTAARELAASGARVLLVDRAEFPRYKACGGGIPLRTERLLPFPIDAVVEDSVHRLRVTHNGRSGFVRDSGAPFAHMVMRDRFDNLLLERAMAAGAEFRPGTAIRGVALDGGVTVTGEGFTAQSELLVCADGAHSPVGRMAGLGEDIAECAAWEVEVRGTAALLKRYRATALIDLDARPWGYAWLFPKASVLSVGVVLPPERASAMKEYVRQFIDRLGLGGCDVEVARGHKVRFRREDEAIARGRVLLAGDAAGLADEFTEEGIFYAIESGRIAARNCLRSLGLDGDLSRYQQEINREIMPELRAARLVSFMFYGMLRRVPRAWMSATAHAPFLWDAFFAVQRGESSYAREAGRVPLLPAIARRMLKDS